jgi:hypothetical protein
MNDEHQKYSDTVKVKKKTRTDLGVYGLLDNQKLDILNINPKEMAVKAFDIAPTNP